MCQHNFCEDMATAWPGNQKTHCLLFRYVIFDRKGSHYGWLKLSEGVLIIVFLQWAVYYCCLYLLLANHTPQITPCSNRIGLNKYQGEGGELVLQGLSIINRRSDLGHYLKCNDVCVIHNNIAHSGISLLLSGRRQNQGN